MSAKSEEDGRGVFGGYFEGKGTASGYSHGNGEGRSDGTVSKGRGKSGGGMLASRPDDTGYALHYIAYR